MGKSVLNSGMMKNRPSVISSSYGLDERGSIPSGDQAGSGAHVAFSLGCTGTLNGGKAGPWSSDTPILRMHGNITPLWHVFVVQSRIKDSDPFTFTFYHRSARNVLLT
jgi:hypothetical protein